MTLPPLPEPWVIDSEEAGTDHSGESIYQDVPLFTSDQMRTYGAACAAAERERCAEMCEKKGHAMQSESEAFRGCDLWIQGGADASLECAAAIRSKS